MRRVCILFPWNVLEAALQQASATKNAPTTTAHIHSTANKRRCDEGGVTAWPLVGLDFGPHSFI